MKLSPKLWPRLAALLSIPLLAGAASVPPGLAIGENFSASTYNVNVVALPPDCNGAVGPAHFVEFINGSFAVYNKTNDHNIKRTSDLHFWSSAGLVLSTDAATTDPRILYDPASQRWFASMVTLNQNATDPTLESNDFLLAVSDAPDPTLGWHGFLLQADPDNGNFADFPTLGVDGTAVYLAGDLFHGQDTSVAPALVSFPKADLLRAQPTITNRTWFGGLSYQERGQVLQPASCFDGSVTGAVVAVSDLGYDSNPHSGLFSFAVQNGAAARATLSQATVIPTESWTVPDNADYGAPLLNAAQPDGTRKLMANDARFSARVNAVAGQVYAVHSTDLGGRLAIRWYRIRAADHLLLESGTLSDPTLDYFFPSIAANAAGVMVISFNGSGPSSFVSCYAVAGQTIGGTTSFGTPVLLRRGATSYHGDDELAADLLGQPPFSRWGDYSATCLDPVNPNRFWTIQMLPSDSANSDVWATQITELITIPALLLSITASPTHLTLSWPKPTAVFQLQSASTVTASWADVTQAPQTNGSQVSVTLPISSAQQFFRLKGT